MAGKRSVGALHATLSLKDISFRRGLQAAGKEITELGKKSAMIGKTVATAGAGLAAAGVAGFAAFAVSSSKAASNIEDLATQFEVLTKSSAITKGLMKTFRDEAAKSPLSVSDYSQAAKTMLSFGVSMEDLVPSLKALGDVSMGNSERFGSLALAFSQTAASGRLMGQEVLQYVNAGFNPLQEISKKTGESMLTLKKRMEDGAISASEVSDAFKSATSEGGMFFGAIEKGAATTSGKIAKFKDSIETLKIAFGTGFNDGLKTALDSANNFLPQLEEKFKLAGSFLGMAITDAVSGDGAKFALIGEYIGTAIAEGMEIGLKQPGKGVMSFMEDFVLQRLEVFDIARYHMMDNIKNDLLDQAIAEKDPVKRKELHERAAQIYSNPRDYREQYNLGNEVQKKRDFVEIGKQFTDGMKGISEKIAEEMLRSAPIEMMGPPKATITNPIVAPITIPEVEAATVDTTNAPERNIDDYQKRGLAMSKTPGAVQDKIMKIQEEIRDILKNAKITGKELVWQ